MKRDEVAQAGIDAINALLDSFMGINDAELASQVSIFFMDISPDIPLQFTGILNQ